MAIAVDLVDRTTRTSIDLPGAILVMVVKTCENFNNDPTPFFPAIPCHYMENITTDPQLVDDSGTVLLETTVQHNLQIIVARLNKCVRNLVTVVLNRPRHVKIIQELCRASCRIWLISDSDVVAPVLFRSKVDLYLSVGGIPEALLSADAIKCSGQTYHLCNYWD